MKKLFIISILISTVFSACKKYENDNGIHLKTAKARLCGDWKLGAYLINGKDSTAAYNAIAPNMALSIKKDGNFTQTASYFGFTFTRTGTWKFLNSKDELGLYETSPGSGSSQFKITKLSSSDLWLYNIDGSKQEYHLITK